MITIDDQIFNKTLKAELLSPPPENELFLYWLGQAGFLIQTHSNTILIDPYLSDSLARKYQGQEFSHQRMTPSPISPAELSNIDFIMCTHRHSDHLDPDTTPVIANHNRELKVIVPAAEKKHAESLGISNDQLVAINVGQQRSLNQDIEIITIAAAHEALKQNEKGEHLYLGYILNFQGITIYHSGDCVPYEGLAEKLKSAKIDLALLPINGRDAYRKQRNVPGNFHLSEAIKLCQQADIPFLIPHHYGMFEFNTVNIDLAKTKIESHIGIPNIRLMDTNSKIQIKSGQAG
jgi:L-ascorbate metabolism protein UlaG (beta-lactamase superfamily)